MQRSLVVTLMILVVTAMVAGCGDEGLTDPQPLTPEPVIDVVPHPEVPYASYNVTTSPDPTLGNATTAELLHELGGRYANCPETSFDPNVIVPGESAFGVRIGGTPQSARTRFGYTQTLKNHRKPGWTALMYDSARIDITPAGRIGSIHIRTDVVRTQEGVGVGSTRAEVVAAYGDPDPDMDDDRDAYFALGIYFWYNNVSGKVDGVLITPPIEPGDWNPDSLNAIVPGRIAAGVKLDSKSADVESLYGSPDERDEKPNGWIVWRYNMGVHVTFAKNKAVRVDVTGLRRQARTEPGIRLGSPRAEVVDAYGQPSRVDGDYDLYGRIGIAFRYNNNKVDQISIWAVD